MLVGESGFACKFACPHRFRVGAAFAPNITSVIVLTSKSFAPGVLSICFHVLSRREVQLPLDQIKPIEQLVPVN